MKYLTVFFVALFGMIGTMNAQSDAITSYFEQYMEDERFTVVYISPKMFQILGKLDIEDLQDEEAQAIMEVVSDLQGLHVLTTEETPKKFYDEAISKFNTNEYEVLMRVRDEGENVHFYTKKGGSSDVINELLLLVGGEDEFVMVSFLGLIDINEISKLAKKLDVKGVEHLDELDKEENYENDYKNSQKN